jgi:hypothetical protein
MPALQGKKQGRAEARPYTRKSRSLTAVGDNVLCPLTAGKRATGFGTTEREGGLK